MRLFVREQLALAMDYYQPFRPRYAPVVYTPAFEPTMAAEDLGGKVDPELPPPPSISVGEVEKFVDDDLAAHGVLLGKTRRARMISNFKALIGEFFIEYTDLYFPEDTNHLISSYNESFRRALALGEILIQSDLFYAGIVEQMEGVEWSKAGTKDHAARECNNDMNAAIPRFLDEARGFALA